MSSSDEYKLCYKIIRNDSSSDKEEKFSCALLEKNFELNYSTLLSMFPNIDSEYIKEICIKPPFKKIEGDPLNMLINHLLGYEEKYDQNNINKTDILNDQKISELIQNQHLEDMEEEIHNEQILNEQLFQEFLEKDQTLINEKLEMLVNILPDANPEQLKECLQQSHEDIDAFVESNILAKNYEKRDQYYAKIKAKEKIKQYTTSFDVKKFLKKFPEPFEHFRNVNRKCTYDEKALNFLTIRYNQISVDRIKNIYLAKKCNLSLADIYLKTLQRIPTKQLHIDIDNTSVLEEIAFLQNNDLIQKYVALAKQKEEKEMRFFKAANLLLTCQCCYDDVKPTDVIECENKHIFCKTCIIRGTDSAMSNNKTSVQCMMGCNNEFALSILEKVLSPEVFEIFSKKRQEVEIMAANINGLVTCPFCPYSVELPPQIKILTCKNTECMKITCRECKKLNHLPIACKDVIDSHKGRLYLEEEMSKGLIRYCKKCNTPFVKSEGCNKVKCRNCSTLMCYLCGEIITDYNHFNDINGCKTHLNTQQFDENRVQIRRIQAITKLLHDNPDLKLPPI